MPSVVRLNSAMPPMFADNIRKVAVTFQREQPQLIELDQGQPLAAVIKDLCDRWNLTNPDDYALKFHENRHDFVTERNRVEITNGNIFQLTLSPSKAAQDILSKLQGTNEANKEDALQQLAQIATDSMFAQEFISQSGLQIVVALIRASKLAGEPLSYALKSFLELMDHGIVSWDLLEPQFIKIVAGSTVALKNGTDSILQYALEILESIVLNSSENYSRLEQEVTPVSLIAHLESANADIQKNAIALINALFLRADAEKRKHIADQLNARSIRQVILNSVIRRAQNIGAEMAHQLYVLQLLLFSMLEEKKMTVVDPNDPQAVADINDLRRIAFDNDRDPHAPQTLTRRQSHSEDYKKLGFTNTINPMSDFTQVPPGALALSNMVYFARQKGEQYTKVVLENSYRNDDHDLPFARASIELTNLLCDILRVGETPTEDGDSFHMLFFTVNDPFEEFYCTCIQLMNKTWKEMKAKRADFEKVLSVVREQVVRALQRKPTTIEKFKVFLTELSYSKITHIWQEERLNKEEGESQARPIVELREQLKPEILQLIKQQRLACLVEGACFHKPNPKRKENKFLFVRLSSNHKMLHHGDIEEEGKQVAFDQLTSKIPVVDIKQLYCGKESPFLKEKKKGSGIIDHAISIVCEHELPELNFYARNETEFHIWSDGLNALLGNPMGSSKVQQELDTLLGMEIKLRLLDTEGIPIPDVPPLIPSEPKNYNFAYGS